MIHNEHLLLDRFDDHPTADQGISAEMEAIYVQQGD